MSVAISERSQAMFSWHISVTEMAFDVPLDHRHMTGNPDGTDAAAIPVNIPKEFDNSNAQTFSRCAASPT